MNTLVYQNINKTIKYENKEALNISISALFHVPENTKFSFSPS